MTTAELPGTEPQASDTAADDVIRMRVWASDEIHVLPKPSLGPWLVGSAENCTVRLADRCVAAGHAQLTFGGGQWWIRDCGTHGIRQDGIARTRFAFTPGAEIGIGTTTLVAESLRCVRFRAFVQRLLGWGGDRLRAVDHALRAIRVARARRSALVLVGDGDLVLLAAALHRRSFRDLAPFIVCDSRRRDGRASVRSPASRPSGMEAFTAAVGGTLCVRHRQLPADIDDVLQRVYEPDSDVQLVVCMGHQDRGAALSGPMAIQIPPLPLRESELPRIVEEYAEDAIATLRAPMGSFTEMDRWWVMNNAARSLPEIEKATLRLVAVATSPTISNAAAQLGMSTVSLNRWLGRRPPRFRGSEPRRAAARDEGKVSRSSASRVGAA